MKTEPDNLPRELLLRLALDEGFEAAGVVPTGPSLTAGAYRAWLSEGHNGEMGYLARPDAVEKRADPRRLLEGAKTVLVVGLNCAPGGPSTCTPSDPSRGVVSRFAQGTDYHHHMLDRLETLARCIEEASGSALRKRAYVDTGPLLEREIAARAGLGFIGKNTMLIHPRLGSWLLLGELLLDVESPGGRVTRPTDTYELRAAASALGTTPTEYEELLAGGTCGRCTRCLDACPTGALVEPYRLDARRCLSYLTIEQQGPIPRSLRPLLGSRIFGCDTCQTACPWNRLAGRLGAVPPGEDRAWATDPLDTWATAGPKLSDLAGLDDAAFLRHFGLTAVARARRRGLLRNVAVALGNWRTSKALPGLLRLVGDQEPLVRGHAAWGLGQVGGPEAAEALGVAKTRESDAWVCDELELALSATSEPPSHLGSSR